MNQGLKSVLDHIVHADSQVKSRKSLVLGKGNAMRKNINVTVRYRELDRCQEQRRPKYRLLAKLISFYE